MTSCAICLEPTTHQHPTLSCSHTFHHSCLAQWLTAHNRCPLCRHNLGDPDDKQEEEVEDEVERSQTTRVVIDIDDGGMSTDTEGWRLFDSVAMLSSAIKDGIRHPCWKERKELWTSKFRGGGGRQYSVVAEVYEREGEGKPPHLIIATAYPMRERNMVKHEIDAASKTMGWHTQKARCRHTKKHSHR